MQITPPECPEPYAAQGKSIQLKNIPPNYNITDIPGSKNPAL